jgi:hypothetical protein
MTLNADISQRNCHVRFTPDNDRESEFPQTVMSALPPKADMCSATMDVRYGPKADISEQAPKLSYLFFARSLGGSYMGTRSAQGTFVANLPL